MINFRVGSRGIFACYAFLIIFNYIVNINRKNLLLYVIIGAAGFLGIFFLLFNMQTIGEIIIKKAPLSRTAVLMANNRLLDLSGHRLIGTGRSTMRFVRNGQRQGEREDGRRKKSL